MMNVLLQITETLVVSNHQVFKKKWLRLWLASSYSEEKYNSHIHLDDENIIIHPYIYLKVNFGFIFLAMKCTIKLVEF